MRDRSSSRFTASRSSWNIRASAGRRAIAAHVHGHRSSSSKFIVTLVPPEAASSRTMSWAVPPRRREDTSQESG
ncbi:MAG TPA: hypothetical protein VEM95_07465, partial [Thermoplasmata archaeon]|nr:hypothetical protein [Thermoplasmata archaeon]